MLCSKKNVFKEKKPNRIQTVGDKMLMAYICRSLRRSHLSNGSMVQTQTMMIFVSLALEGLFKASNITKPQIDLTSKISDARSGMWLRYTIFSPRSLWSLAIIRNLSFLPRTICSGYSKMASSFFFKLLV